MTGIRLHEVNSCGEIHTTNDEMLFQNSNPLKRHHGLPWHPSWCGTWVAPLAQDSCVAGCKHPRPNWVRSGQQPRPQCRSPAEIPTTTLRHCLHGPSAPKRRDPTVFLSLITSALGPISVHFPIATAMKCVNMNSTWARRCGCTTLSGRMVATSSAPR